MSIALPENRAKLLEALEQEMRKTSAQSVLFSQAVADRLGMNSTDLECLDVLEWTGPVPAGQLAEITGLTTGAITGVLDRLEKGGFVRREIDPDDRRRVIVRRLTDRDKELAPLYESLRQEIAQLTSRYSDEQLVLILDYATRANQIAREETLKLREGTARGTHLESGDFSAPLGGVTRGRLVFTSGSPPITIKGDPSMTELYRAHFTRPVPNVRVQGGTVTIRYPLLRISDWLFNWHEEPVEVMLNASIPWEIVIQGGVSKLAADLRELQLRSFTFEGGVSQAKLTLSRPSGTIPIRITGGVNDLTIHRPAGVAMQVQASGGLNNATLDGKRFTSVGAVHWGSPSYKSAPDRYDVTLEGGVNNVTAGTK
jgi:DNA-binding MarR family transcriptional regulator